jgi:proteasome beta subunit
MNSSTAIGHGNPPAMKNGVRTGTTTVGFIVKDAVILAADKRATEGFYIATGKAMKILKITDRIWSTIAGSVADAQYLIDLMAAQAHLFELQTGRSITVNTVVKILAGELFRHKAKGMYEVQHIIGGVDDEGPKLFDVGGDGSIIKEDCTSTGSGLRFSYGVLEDGYKEGMSIEEGIELAKKAIFSAISRDVFTGTGADVFIITKDGTEHKFFKPNE